MRFRFATVLLFLVCITMCGCVTRGTDIAPSPTNSQMGGLVREYVDGSIDDAASLTPVEAKAIVVARAAGVDLTGGGKGNVFGSVTFRIYELPNDWYVYCSGGRVGNGRTVHLDRDFKFKAMNAGPPPREISDGATTRP